MATLHVLSHSPFADTRLDSCLRLAGPDDGLLLCGDAVYALQPGSLPCKRLTLRGGQLAGLKIFAHRVQLAAGPAQALDYPGFVSLSLAFDKVNSWL
jgi:tRNA 2-thiouridine synthesizing protein B